MQQAESNCNLMKVDLSFPYLRVLLQGMPGYSDNPLKYPPMDRVHRAKIFAPFAALEGYSEKIHEKDRSLQESPPERKEENICEFWDNP